MTILGYVAGVAGLFLLGFCIVAVVKGWSEERIEKWFLMAILATTALSLASLIILKATGNGQYSNDTAASYLSALSLLEKIVTVIFDIATFISVWVFLANAMAVLCNGALKADEAKALLIALAIIGASFCFAYAINWESISVILIKSIVVAIGTLGILTALEAILFGFPDGCFGEGCDDNYSLELLIGTIEFLLSFFLSVTFF